MALPIPGPGPGARRRSNKERSLVAAARRRGRIRTRANGDVMARTYETNNTNNARAGKKFEIGLSADGNIVHLYHLGGGKVQRIELPTPQKPMTPSQRAAAGHPPVASPVLGAGPGLPTHIQTAAHRRSRVRRTVTYGTAVTTP